MKRLIEMLMHNKGQWWEVTLEEGDEPTTTTTRVFILPALLAYIKHKLNQLGEKK